VDSVVADAVMAGMAQGAAGAHGVLEREGGAMAKLAGSVVGQGRGKLDATERGRADAVAVTAAVSS